MILNSKIEIKVNPNSREYYNDNGYECENYDIIIIDTIDLPKGSNIKIDVKCDNCKSESLIVYNKYYRYTDGLKSNYYCRKCNYIKGKKTKLEKYGDENYTNIEKSKKTKLKKYGDENYTNRKKAKSTILEKYGVENISQLDDIKLKKKQTFLSKYGVDNPFKSNDIKDKIKETVYEKYDSEFYLTSEDCKKKYKKFCDKYGVNHYSKTEEFKNKFKETCLLKWGESTNLLNVEIKEKIKKTNLLRYGFDHVMKNKEVSLLNTKSLIENRYNFFFKLGYEYLGYDYDKSLYKLKNLNCDHIFEINYDLFRSRIKYSNSSCLVCYPKKELSSIKEKELVVWLESLGIKTISNNRKILCGKELDIYLPNYNIAIEFNGLYYHSDKFKEKNYHLDKTKLCESMGIDLIHVWEDDWIYRKDIIKSIILNRLSLINNKIYARKCKIKLVSKEESKEFLNENHIQGNTNSSIKIGLYFKDQLVSLMTFGKRRINSKSEYELIRFCNKINFVVVGSSSRLFKYFIDNYKIENKIVSYSDRSIFKGNLYKKLGFSNNGYTSLNYYWTDLNKRYHRFNYNKKKLIKMGYDENLTEEQIMKNIGFYKIWSCGQLRWIYNI